MISDTSSQEEQQQQDPSSSSSSSTNRPNNTLKNRIMMAMETTTHSKDDNDDAKEVHISSVLAAASALASLGNQGSTPPSPSTLVDLASGLESEEHAVKSFPQKVRVMMLLYEYAFNLFASNNVRLTNLSDITRSCLLVILHTTLYP